jgi:nucleoside-diphosphate-sugar epimerase
MKVLITGATGFIGKNVLENLYENTNYDIVCTYNKTSPWLKDDSRIHWIKADLRIESNVQFALNGIDRVIHCAATTSGAKDIVSRPYMHVTDNVIMTSLLLRESFEANIESFIFMSCSIMYPSSMALRSETSFKSTMEIEEKYFGAGCTKVYLENMCEFYSRISNIKFLVIRHSNIYGKYDKFDLEKGHVTASTMVKIFNNTNGTINVWGSGNECRDILYIEDLLSFLNKAMTNLPAFDIVNVGSSCAISIRELVKTIIKVTGKDLRLEFDTSMPSIPTNIILDCSKAIEEYGWHPQFTLEEGILQTYGWFKENIANRN